MQIWNLLLSDIKQALLPLAFCLECMYTLLIYKQHGNVTNSFLGKKWVFPCGKWLAKDEDDGKIERDLVPQDIATEEYMPCEYFFRSFLVLYLQLLLFLIWQI